MTTFRMSDVTVGFTIAGVDYEFLHVDSFVIEDPQRVRLTRGANAGNKIGLAYKEGTKEAKTITIAAMALTPEHFELLKTAYKNEERIDLYAIASDGSGKFASNAVLSQEPQQLTIDDTAESMVVSIIAESFDVTETHNS